MRLSAHSLSALVTLLTFALSPAQGTEQGNLAVEHVSFTAATAYDGGASVKGELRIPDSGRDRVPVVLILHSSAGIDGTGAFYARALNQAGIATLEIEMFFSRASRPQSTRGNMPHGYGSLLFLASNPRIDVNHIGVMGFSWGGAMALLMASEEVTQQYTGGKARFAAHLALYPVCYAHLNVMAGANKFYGPGTYRQLTGAPVHILAGEKDDFDDPDSCPKLGAAFPEEDRRHLGVTVYPGAYHSWDKRDAQPVYDPIAYKGRGGQVRQVWNAEIASQSREFAVEFFTTNLVTK